MTVSCCFSIYFIIVFSGQLNIASGSIDQAGFIKYGRLYNIDGLVCTSNRTVFKTDNVTSGVECAVLCSNTDMCFAISYNSETRKCTGCNYFGDNETLIDAGTKFYSRIGYRLIQQRLNWKNAKAKCSELGGSLVSIKSLQQHDFIVRILSGFYGVDTDLRLWIGGNDMATEGTFLWEDGTAFPDTPDATKWGPGEPSNQYSREHCVQLYNEDGEWYWNDDWCVFELSSVCDMN
ncbi:L-selectin-like [Ruditapes philippinarum]|uniref:L-selectin-like n=1 Tax=Ruditapes philippinarum TaxID=129788 RepID=UPI00295BFF15|nr:L-selectin-like [Ruditapes philippinarum]